MPQGRTTSRAAGRRGTLVLGGGVERVLSGGLARGTTVSSGGYQLDFGSAVNVTLGSAATRYVDGGGIASVTSTGSGATQYIVALAPP